MAGVSKATVSRVINQSINVSDDVSRRVEDAMKTLEYFPNLLARGIKNTSSRSIGIVFPELSGDWYPPILAAMGRFAVSQNYSVLVFETGGSAEREEEYLALLAARHVDGIILDSSAANVLPIHESLKKYKIPCVLFGQKIQGMDYDGGIFLDNEYAFFRAASQLIARNNRRIVFLSGPKERSVAREQFEGYRYALSSSGIPLEEGLVCCGACTVESGFQMVSSLLERQIPFSAILAASDSLAAGAVRALRQSGMEIPQEVEVIGFGDAAYGMALEPELTTIQAPIPKMAQAAVSDLLLLIENAVPEKRSRIYDTRLMIRGTTRQEINVNRYGGIL